MGFRDLLVLPFLDGVGQEARLLVGIRGVVMFFFEVLDGVVAGGGFRGGVGMGHGGSLSCIYGRQFGIVAAQQ